MGELRRISNDEIVIAILSLWYGVPVTEITRICNDLTRNQEKHPGREKELPELERIATETKNRYRK